MRPAKKELFMSLKNLELTQKIGNREYKSRLKEIREKLTLLQQTVMTVGIPVLIVFEGWSASGKGTQINRLFHSLDPRYYRVYTMEKLSEDAEMRPFLWKYWIKTPSRGMITIFDKSWYRLVLPVEGNRILKESELNNYYYDVNAFEDQLTLDGTLIIKLFLHISKDEQAKRFAELENDPDTNWRVDGGDRRQNGEYGRQLALFDDMIEQSDRGLNKWSLIEAEDKNFATLRICDIIISKIEKEIERRGTGAKAAKGHKNTAAPSALAAVDLSKSISNQEYKEKLTFYQNRIAHLGFKLYKKRCPVVIVFEGWDAAGKGGNIKRLVQELDPRGYEVVPIAAPTQEELGHHYLWRFWKKMPKDGHLTIFDRSWYGRVLVERVEKLATEAEWRRAYKEINDMEQHLCNHGTVIFKFWVHVDMDEQLRRFEERRGNPLKQHKINDEDWRNRGKWEDYESAVNDMIALTSTERAPWTIIESNSKKYARVKVLEYVTDKLEMMLR